MPAAGLPHDPILLLVKARRMAREAWSDFEQFDRGDLRTAWLACSAAGRDPRTDPKIADLVDKVVMLQHLAERLDRIAADLALIAVDAAPAGVA
ncbi:hypothetical protein ABB55_08535 [Prosthecomicrobium hirschii]|uniref:Uncharacterized protein n=1 Tax=Prosthecodimorpha hirschii TaxID=665126 RepID=A0A0N8GER7_9HYPH|nr:hypothetical protein [Prosthecomicrobium hirschii]KPL52273.1 hypothetical protein ABB55_08535 [Prosthecomicrobium hirschii]